MKLDDLSKALSHALRHEPWVYELELDDEGWASLDAVIGALRDQAEDWRNLSRMDVERMTESSVKRRHEILGSRIRALYGHSVPGKCGVNRQRRPWSSFTATQGRDGSTRGWCATSKRFA